MIALLLISLIKMKKSVRPLFSILLLIVIAATLSCRTSLRPGFISLQLEDNVDVTVKGPIVPVINSTLLKFAAIDVGEAQLKQEVEHLLEGNFGSVGHYRSISSWRRFNHFDMPARSRTNPLPIQLRSPNFYRRWIEFRRVLHDWSRKKRFRPEIMSELINLVKHPIDKHNGLVNSSRRYSSCAVVGNSGILLKSNQGKLIDSHEVVIRLNNARTESFEFDVGSTTSISFINSHILHRCARRQGCPCHPYGANVPIVLYICQPLHLLDYTFCNSSHAAPLLLTDTQFDLFCARIVKYYSLKRFVEETGKSAEEWGSAHDGVMFHYSSGMQAVMLALSICDKVSLFGFGKSVSAKHHYHTNQKAELQLHDYEAEYAFYRDLVEERTQLIPFLPENFKIPPVIVYQ